MTNPPPTGTVHTTRRGWTLTKNPDGTHKATRAQEHPWTPK